MDTLMPVVPGTRHTRRCCGCSKKLQCPNGEHYARHLQSCATPHVGLLDACDEVARWAALCNADDFGCGSQFWVAGAHLVMCIYCGQFESGVGATVLHLERCTNPPPPEEAKCDNSLLSSNDATKPRPAVAGVKTASAGVMGTRGVTQALAADAPPSPLPNARVHCERTDTMVRSQRCGIQINRSNSSASGN